MLVYPSYDAVPGRAVLKVTSDRDAGFTDVLAFSSGDTLTFTVSVPRAFCTSAAKLRLYRDDDMSHHEFAASALSVWDADDVFGIELAAASVCLDGQSGLFYFTFALETPYGELYVSADGRLTPDRIGVSCTQLTVYRKDFHTPAAFGKGMMYQIFVDRFSDGGRPVPPTEGKCRNGDWYGGIPQYAEVPGGEVANNMFFGGNLWGVAEKLDYIRSLGVDTVYLCPIFEAASNHKYDTGDYLRVDEMFGGDEALDALIEACRERDMKLILDGVFNHTGDDSRYFNRYGHYPEPGAWQSRESRWADWYSFEDFPDRYRCWWGVKILPAVNSADPSYRNFICGEDGVAAHWLKRGIAGWRLDVADELADVFLDDLRRTVKKVNPDAMILGEVWEDASNKVAYDKRRRYFRGGQLDSVMNYPLKEAVIDFVKTGDCGFLIESASRIYSHYPREVSRVLMNFLGTHDTERILTVLADAGTDAMTNRELASFRHPPEQRAAAKTRLKQAWAILCAFPGIPCIYYGDEAGMEGGRDPFNRMPYPWGQEDAELTDFYRQIGAARAREPAFFEGGVELVRGGLPGQLLILRRINGISIAAAANLSDQTWMLEFERSAGCIYPDDRKGRFIPVEPGEVCWIRYW